MPLLSGIDCYEMMEIFHWLVVSTHLKNIDSQIGSFTQVGVKINKYLKPPPSPALFEWSWHCFISVFKCFGNLLLFKDWWTRSSTSTPTSHWSVANEPNFSKPRNYTKKDVFVSCHTEVTPFFGCYDLQLHIGWISLMQAKTTTKSKVCQPKWCWVERYTTLDRKDWLCPCKKQTSVKGIPQINRRLQ